MRETWKWGMTLLALGLSAGWLAAQQDLGSLRIAAERLPRWRPGVEDGLPEVPVRINARDAGTSGDGVQDDAPAIQRAIDAVETPGAVLLPEGSYRLESALKLRSGVVLRGEGPARTRLVADHVRQQPSVIELVGVPPRPSERDLLLASGFDAGSTRLVLERPAELRIGSVALLVCDNDPELLYTRDLWDADWARNVVGQVVRIQAIEGARLELDRPLRLSYRAALRPRLSVFAAIERAGVEDLHIRQVGTNTSNILRMHHAMECWAKNVHLQQALRAHVWISNSRGAVVRDSLMHHAHNYGGGGHGYGVVAGRLATDCLVENNVFDHLRHAMMTKEGANGNVFGYNASYRCVHNCDISQHGHYSYMNLFEGNVVQRIVYADYWGPTGPGSTSFRNRVENAGLNVRGAAIEIRDHSHDANVLLNTLVASDLRVSDDSLRAHIEKNLFLAAKPSGTDPLARESGMPSWTAPASLYLSGKPAWWGDNRPWPGIGAEVDLAAVLAGGELPPIPAVERHRVYRQAASYED